MTTAFKCNVCGDYDTASTEDEVFHRNVDKAKDLDYGGSRKVQLRISLSHAHKSDVHVCAKCSTEILCDFCVAYVLRHGAKIQQEQVRVIRNLRRK